MLKLQNVREIETLLLDVPAIVVQLERNDPEFVASVKSWLATVENTFTNNRMPEASGIAVLRGAAISAERGGNTGAAGAAPTNTRKVRNAVVANLLRAAADVVGGAIKARRAQFDEAESITMQVVAAADRLGLIPARSTELHTAYLESVLQAISNRAELTSHVVHIVGLLGHGDTLVMLDRAMTAVRH